MPLACLLVGMAFGPWGWAAWLIFPLQILRQTVRNHGPVKQRALLALFQLLARFPETCGQIMFMRDRLLGPKSVLWNISDVAMRIAYLVNRYPTVSHSFIRREIQALERCGVEVTRIALREWKPELLDAENQIERKRTRYVRPRRRGNNTTDCRGADAANASSATIAGIGAGVAHGSPRGGTSAALSPCLSGRGLSHRTMVARGRRRASARPFRDQFGGGRDAGARAGWTTMELHRPRHGAA